MVISMGIYLNPGNDKFFRAINSEIYVDKSELMIHTNKKLMTQQSYFCVTRPRRFGKSTAANMLAAYYGRDCDSSEMFNNLKIAKHESYEKHLNKYDVIFLNMQEFLSRTETMTEMLEYLKKSILWDLLEAYPDFRYFNTNDLIRTMHDVYKNTIILGGTSYILIFIGALLLGIFCALNEDKFIDKIIVTIGNITSSIPSFWIALILILIFSVNLKILPSSGLLSGLGRIF